jgi:hypothetical protein
LWKAWTPRQVVSYSETKGNLPVVAEGRNRGRNKERNRERIREEIGKE